MTAYFLDTEFHDDGRVIDLISIAMVCEDGRELYMVSSEFDEEWATTDTWLVENVLPQIQGEQRYTKDVIAEAILVFTNNDDKVEIYAWYGAYDWVVLCQLFGAMSQLPDNFSKWHRELKREIGKIRFPKNSNAHNSLEDARWARDMYSRISEGALR